MLNLEHNPDLGKTGAYYLCQCEWPALQPIRLGCELDAMATCCLLTAAWKNLKHISLTGADFRRSCALQFQLGDWSKLGCLQLRKCNINGVSVSCLVEGQWPHLTYLDLHGNSLGSHAFDFLSQAHWPVLKVWILSKTMFDLTDGHHMLGNDVAADCIAKLSKTQWSSLTVLDLSDHAPDLSDVAMGHLTALPGTFQSLQKLNLSLNQFPVPMMRYLAEANFPCLRCLNLANCALNTYDLEVLSTSKWHMLQCLVVGAEKYDADFVRALQGKSGRQLRKGSNNVKGWAGQLARRHWQSMQILVIGDDSEWFHRWQY